MMENNESMEQAAKPADNSDSINKNNDILIRTENLVKAYGNILAVDHLNLSIHRGKSLACWVPTAPAKPQQPLCF